MKKKVDRPIRVLIGKPGLDGHDVGAKILCRILAEAGMEVVYTGLRKSPEAIVKAAVEEDVDVLGLSILSGAHLPLCRKVARERARHGRRALWIVGGNIPARDAEPLRELGVDGVFPAGAKSEQIVSFIQERLAGGRR